MSELGREWDPGLPAAVAQAQAIDPDIGWLDVATSRAEKRDAADD